MAFDDEPAPDLCDDEIQSHGAVALCLLVEALQQLEFVLAGASQEGADQTILGAEEEEQHSGTGTDGRCERAQRDVGQTVLEDVAVRQLEEFVSTGQRGVTGDGGDGTLPE